MSNSNSGQAPGQNKTVLIIVNGRPREVTGKSISYEDRTCSLSATEGYSILPMTQPLASKTLVNCQARTPAREPPSPRIRIAR